MLILISIVLVLGTASYYRNELWQDEMSLWIDVVSKAPHNYSAWSSVGNTLREAGRPHEAIKKYRKAISIRPTDPKPWYNWGNALSNLGRPHEAIKKYRKAISIQPDFAKPWINWGTALVGMERLEQALEKYEKALSLNPDISGLRKKIYETRGIIQARKK